MKRKKVEIIVISDHDESEGDSLKFQKKRRKVTRKRRKKRRRRKTDDDDDDCDFFRFFPEHKKKNPSTVKTTEVVRGKKKRERMTSDVCHDCTEFYRACEHILPKKIVAKIIKVHSRHRYDKTHTKTPRTPEGYWDMNFFESGDEDENKN